MKTIGSLLRKSALVFCTLIALSASAAYAGENNENTESDAMRAALNLGIRPIGAKALDDKGESWMVYDKDGQQVIISLDDDGIVIDTGDVAL